MDMLGPSLWDVWNSVGQAYVDILLFCFVFYDVLLMFNYLTPYGTECHQIWWPALL